MITFRQGSFSKKVIKKVSNYIKKHPLIPISTASLGVGVANYATNTKRREEGIKQHTEQLNALKELNNNIVNNNKAIRGLTISLEKKDLGLKNEPDKETKRDKSLFLLFKKKKFSIQDGGFNGRKVVPKKSNISVSAGVGATIGSGLGLMTAYGNSAANKTIFASIGALLGAGVGALSTWLSNKAKESVFNKELASKENSYTLIKGLENLYSRDDEEEIDEFITVNHNGDLKHINTIRYKQSTPSSTVSPVGTLFSIDNDPKKHVANVLLKGNVLLILLNKPNNLELTKINSILDNYCKKYNLADYAATKLETNMYLVEVSIVRNTVDYLVSDIIDSGLKINILTTDRIGIKNI